MKELKAHIVKSLAILICIIYIVMPINMEIRSVLHTISHSLKGPSYVFQHNEIDNHKFVNQAKFDIKSGSHEHNHEHKILDFLNSVFESASDKGDSQKGESTNLDFKINKHIKSKKYTLIFAKINYVETPSYWMQNQFEMKGYFNKLYRPPQV